MRLQIADCRLQILRSTLVILALGLLASVPAQTTLDYLAAGSPNGIFVMLGTRVAAKGQALSAYRVERRTAGGAWQQLADVSGPASLAEFRAAVEKARDLSPEPVDMKALPVDRIWQDIARAGNVDSLRFPGQLLEVRLAFGLLYVDRSAEQDRDYEYRVSELDATGVARPVLLSGKAHWPFAVPFAPLRVTEARADEKEVSITWRATGKMRGCSFRVFRDEGLAGRFEPIPALRIISNKDDTTTYFLSDTTVAAGHLYRYFAVTFCRYGNTGPTTETTLVATYRFRNLPLPTNLAAESTSSGLRLRWQLSQPLAVKSLRIYRSETWDSGYTRIAEVSPQGTNWLDQTAAANTKYYYYLEMTGFLDEVSPPSARFFGMFESSEPPLAPFALFAEPLSNGVRLRWDLAEPDVAGCYVFRRDPLAGGWRQVSDLIPASTANTFVDSGPTLSPQYQYGYFVRAITASKVLGPASETAYARPHGDTRPPVPLGLTAEWKDGAVKLYWDDMQPGHPALSGYWLLRRSGSGQFAKTHDSLLPARQNQFTDTTAAPGKTYEYLVVAEDIFGKQGDSAARTTVAIPIPVPAAPAGLRAHATASGIELSWDEPFGPVVTGYRVYRYERGREPARIASPKPGTTTYADNDVTRGRLYFYYLTSVGEGWSESGPSAEVSITYRP
jgi:hypothetical protein